MLYQTIMADIPWMAKMESEMSARRCVCWLSMHYAYDFNVQFNIIEIDERGVRPLLTNSEERSHICFHPLGKINNRNWRALSCLC